MRKVPESKAKFGMGEWEYYPQDPILGGLNPWEFAFYEIKEKIQGNYNFNLFFPLL